MSKNFDATIVIPTYRRSQPLRRALASAVAQACPAGVICDVVVVDNSPEAGARDDVAAVSAGSAIPVHYLHEPRPGIANARNAGLAAASGAWIAFLDDDEEAGPDWIATFARTLETTGADAAFGPVSARAEQSGGDAALLPYFERRVEAKEGDNLARSVAYLGTNNSIFSKARCFPDPAPFDPALNESGGEDSLVLKRLILSGRKLVWSPGAGVTEWVPSARLNAAYVGRRLFLSGQIRSFVLTMLDPPRWHEVALWMGVGSVQAAIGAVRYALTRPFGRARAQGALFSIRRGLGKVLWMKRFRPQLYGSGLVS